MYMYSKYIDNVRVVSSVVEQMLSRHSNWKMRTTATHIAMWLVGYDIFEIPWVVVAAISLIFQIRFPDAVSSHGR